MIKEPTIPQSLNWVEARWNCSLSKIFLRLQSDVKADVDTVNKLLQQQAATESGTGRPRREFEFHSSTSDHFSVIRSEALRQPRSVEFSLKQVGISIEGDASVEAVPALNSEGRCLLAIGEREYELWQVRQLALENYSSLKDRAIRNPRHRSRDMQGFLGGGYFESLLQTIWYRNSW